jgi:hypothetical protein
MPISSNDPHATSPSAGLEPALVMDLVQASYDFDTALPDPERNCWLAVHRHVHGVLPSEYDIREVPEALVLAVLAERRRRDSETLQ